MVICGSSMFEFSVDKDMKKWFNKEGGSSEGSDTFMPNTSCQRVED